MPKKSEFSLLEKINTEDQWLGLANKKVRQYCGIFVRLVFKDFQTNAQISCKKKKKIASVVQLLIADAFKDDLARSANLCEVDFGKPAKK